jgi:lauroyl/myristoyl acyltransferase
VPLASPPARERAAAPATPGARVAAYMRDLRADPGRVWEAIRALDADTLRPHGVQACHLNLVSLFGGARPAAEVREMAAECARLRLWRGWSYYAERTAALKEGTSADIAPALEGWDRAAFDDLLRAHRGVLVCGFHFGSYRYVPTDLAGLGLPVSFAVDTRVQEQDLWSAGDLARTGGAFRMTGIDDPAALVTLVRALRGGGVAYLNVDASRGWGAGHTAHSHAPVRFLDLDLKVMTGAARMAAANGAAILPAAAVPDGVSPGRIALGAPLSPPSAGKSERWAADAMQSLYDFFAPHVQAAPAEWQDVRFLHRWRASASPPSTPTSAEPSVEIDSDAQVERHLTAGAAFRLDEDRCVRLDGGGGTDLVDARTLRSFRAPAWSAALVAALADGGAGEGWLRAHLPDEEGRARAVGLLGALDRAGLLRTD